MLVCGAFHPGITISPAPKLLAAAVAPVITPTCQNVAAVWTEPVMVVLFCCVKLPLYTAVESLFTRHRRFCATAAFVERAVHERVRRRSVVGMPENVTDAAGAARRAVAR